MEQIQLYSDDHSQTPILIPYLVPSGKPTGAVIVCPGGGYAHLAPHEGEPIARWVNSRGYSAFVLHYRLAHHPAPLEDAKRAIQYVRYKAAEFNVAPDKIAILGFSAGGHLAASAGTLFTSGDPNAEDPIARCSSRPDAMILCYPVISFGPCGHQGSMVNLLGENPPKELVEKLSLENAVTKQTPPAFIWHTQDDEAVPVENSLLFAKALKKHGVPFALHIYPHGRHGLGLGEGLEASWTGLCGKWLESLGFRGQNSKK
jgi:acetyl esterase/lipase